jgi:hypothetical protein
MLDGPLASQNSSNDETSQHTRRDRTRAPPDRRPLTPPPTGDRDADAVHAAPRLSTWPGGSSPPDPSVIATTIIPRRRALGVEHLRRKRGAEQLDD